MRSSVLYAAAALAGAPLAADDAGEQWRRLAEIDSAAALELIESSHPGAAPELADRAFAERLTLARLHLSERLPQVRSYEGHAAVLTGLANDFGDGHIWSHAVIAPAGISWAGLVTGRRGDGWYVAADRNPGADLAEARIVACDGMAADELAQERLGRFRAQADVPASMAANAHSLLIDDGNPFLARPRSCTFALPAGGEIERGLAWRPERRTSVSAAVAEASLRADAGLGIEPVEGGYWIGLNTLGTSAEAVVEQAEALGETLRGASLVVVDLRGNSGGDSRYSTRLATILASEAAVAQASHSESACRGAFWRASPGNLAALEEFAASASGDARAYYAGLTAEMAAALAEDQSFAPALPSCAADAAPAAERPTDQPLRGRVVLVTDRACFSSCLLATDLFRRLGALHLGEATDRSTRYMEVREIVLPSGLRTFSTLQKLTLGAGDFGPYEPAVRYPGRMADDAALRAWVLAIADGS